MAAESDRVAEAECVAVTTRGRTGFVRRSGAGFAENVDAGPSELADFAIHGDEIVINFVHGGRLIRATDNFAPLFTGRNQNREPPSPRRIDEPFAGDCCLTCVTRERNEVFTAFYAEHWPAVAGYCAGLVRSGHLGDDLAQGAFIRLYARWGRPKDPLAYTYRIAHNLAFDHRRSLARGRHQIAEPICEGTDHGLLDAVHRLPRALRDVTLLHYFADLPLAQVAQVLRRPLGTVKRQLHDARHQLADALKEVP